jgi:adenosylmethionine-8-amino-7-oxononanoate aminotransferase
MAVSERTRKPAREAQTRFELDADRLVELDRRHKLPGFASLDEHARDGSMLIVRGKGVFVWDVRGKQYLDGSSAIWNVNLGYGQTEVAEAVRD